MLTRAEELPAPDRIGSGTSGPGQQVGITENIASANRKDKGRGFGRA